MIAIDRHQTVEALDLAARAFKHVAAGIGVDAVFRIAVIAQGLGFRIAGGIGGQVAAGQRRRITLLRGFGVERNAVFVL